MKEYRYARSIGVVSENPLVCLQRLLAVALFLLSGAIVAQSGGAPGDFPQPDAKAQPDAKTGKSYVETASASNLIYKFSGVIYSGYEFTDHETNGAVDASGPDKQDTGFFVGRAYLNFTGDAEQGNWKGWGFRITTDFSPAASLGDGCGADCSQNNDYVLILKFAYVNIPLSFMPKTYLRLGQQQTPPVDGQAGISLQSVWENRYIDSGTWEEVGLASSTDRGLGFIHKSDYFGLHLLLANGESYHKNNAQLIKNSTLSSLANGSGDSHGLDLYGLFSLSPTGKAKDFQVLINFPFRMHNFRGIDDSETNYMTANIGTPGMFPNPVSGAWLVGDKRALQDYSYGVETDVIFQTPIFKITLGVGTAIKLDRRSNAYLIDENGVDTSDPANVVSQMHTAQDARAVANYVFVLVRYNWIGAFGRYIVANTNTLSSKTSAPDGRSWEEQVVMRDAADGTMGNMGYWDLKNNIDLGKGQSRNLIIGITFYPHPDFTVAIGINTLTGRDMTGREYRVNPLERVQPDSGASGNLSQQVERHIAQNFGLNASDDVNLNDFIGTKQMNRQMFIRTEFKF